MARITIRAIEIQAGDVVEVMGLRLLVKPGNRAADKFGVDLYLGGVQVTLLDREMKVTVERPSITEEEQ